jgi:predicted transposase/invertase (TIGR01784 family)
MAKTKEKILANRRPPSEKLKKKSTGKGKDVFVNLLTDFGFKRIFGIKEVMLHFLNTVLASEIKSVIVDLHYDNTERPGITRSDRKAYYDLICTTEKNERIVVEMQVGWHEFFKDRILSYISNLIQDQNVKGKDWDFQLHPIFFISIVNFPFDKTDLTTEKYASFIQLIDRDTHRVYYDKLTLINIELPRFNKELKEVKTFFDQWLYIIGCLHELDEIPKAFRNKIFEKLFEEAKIARMTKEEKNNYYISLKNLRAMDITRIEINKLKNANTAKDNIIATMGKDLATKDNDLAIMGKLIAEQEKELAEYRQKFGVN